MQHPAAKFASAPGLLLLALALSPRAIAGPDIREGMWEVSVLAEVGGQPLTAAPMVVRQCISNQSVQGLMAQMGGAGACLISDFKQTGNRARWNITCSGPMAVSGTGETEITGDQFTGRMNLVVTMSAQSLPMVQNFEAKRVGECQQLEGRIATAPPRPLTARQQSLAEGLIKSELA
jgi:Protein of unknown function (DUF3617)